MLPQSISRTLLWCVVGLAFVISVSARVLSPPQSYDINPPTSSKNEDNTHISQSYRDCNSSYPEIHPSFVRRHHQSLSILHHLAPSNSHTKRSLVTPLAQGIAFFFTHLDIVIATTIEANYMSEFYRIFIADMSPEQRLARQRVMHFGDPDVFRLALQYGVLKMVAIDTRDNNFVTDDQIVDAVVLFAGLMLNATRHMGVILFDAWLLVQHVWVQVRVFIQARNLVT
ncbi:MAG: hypothetical protein Q9226_004208 [Calogaya cf. arnoldii]